MPVADRGPERTASSPEAQRQRRALPESISNVVHCRRRGPSPSTLPPHLGQEQVTRQSTWSEHPTS